MYPTTLHNAEHLSDAENLELAREFWIWRSGCARNMITPRERRNRNLEEHNHALSPP